MGEPLRPDVGGGGSGGDGGGGGGCGAPTLAGSSLTACVRTTARCMEPPLMSIEVVRAPNSALPTPTAHVRDMDMEDRPAVRERVFFLLL